MLYQDTMGIDNPHATQIDVRRFDDKHGHIVLVVDNYYNASKLSVGFDGVQHAVPAEPLAIIEVNASTVKLL